MSVNDIHKRRHASDKDDLKKYLVQSNSVKTFLDGFCAYDPAVQAQNAAALKDVYASYARFCQYPPKETVDIERFGVNVKKFCNNQKGKKYGNIRKYPGFVFYEDEFIEYMKSQSAPVEEQNIGKGLFTGSTGADSDHKRGSVSSDSPTMGKTPITEHNGTESDSRTCAECGKNILQGAGRMFKGETYCGPNCIQSVAKRLDLNP